MFHVKQCEKGKEKVVVKMGNGIVVVGEVKGEGVGIVE